jgi:hypothetical protein
VPAFAFEPIASALLQADLNALAAVWPTQASALDRQRFDVHRNNVLHSLITALAEGFPSVLKLVGEPFFTAVAAAAVRASPPRHPVLLAYGAEFPDFLQHFPPLAGLPYLADVARIDGLRRRAWHAPDAAPIEPAALASLSIEAAAELRVGLHPSAAMLDSAHAARSIWQAQNDEAKAQFDPQRAESSLIWRRGEQVRVRSLDDAASALAACVQALRQSPRLDQLLAEPPSEPRVNLRADPLINPSAHPRAAAGFAEALSLGLIVRAEAATTDPLFDPFTSPSSATAVVSHSAESTP